MAALLDVADCLLLWSPSSINNASESCLSFETRLRNADRVDHLTKGIIITFNAEL